MACKRPNKQAKKSLKLLRVTPSKDLQDTRGNNQFNYIFNILLKSIRERIKENETKKHKENYR